MPARTKQYVLRCTFLASHTTPSDFKPKSRCPNIRSDRSITRELGNDYHGWAIYTDGGTRVADGEVFAGWSVISRYPRGRIFVLFGPVITTEAHLTFWCQNSLQQHR